ncbi:MAG: hypothetical protein ACE5FT_03370 [Candidatus Nanoarchaeia archaeon]
MEVESVMEASFDEARQLIEGVIAERKKKGVRNVDVIDLFEATHLPYKLINEVMEQLENEGKVLPGKEFRSAFFNP